MQFSAALLVVASALSAASAHSFSDGNGLQARSAKGLLHHMVRSLDEYEAREIVARYDDELEESFLSKRDYTCPDCGQSFVLIGEFTEHRAAHKGNGKNMKKPGKKAPAKKAPAKKGRK